MKEQVEQEKRNPLLDSIDIDYTSSSCLIDQVDMEEGGDGGNSSSGNGASGGQTDFLLGDMGLMFDGGQGASPTAGGDEFTFDSNRKNNNDSSNNKKSKGSNDGKKNNSSSSAQSDSTTPFFNDETKFEPRPSVGGASSLPAQEGEIRQNGTWQSETTDKQARQTMILEIARLLKSRKKTQPATEWLQQLPHKARKLEEKLYRSAPSLNAYQDLSTLKNRLRAVAQAITKNHVKSRHSFSSLASRRASTATTSSSSTGSTFSSLRSSLSSQSHIMHRDSISSNVSTGTLGSLNQQMAAISAAASATSAIPSSIESRRSSSIVSAQQRPSMRAIPEDMFSAGNTKGMAPMGSGPQGMQQPPPQGGNPTDSQSMLEQQKALNEKLRMEIQENIRKQNEWFKTLQNQQSGGVSSNSGGAAPGPGGSSMGAVAGVMPKQSQNVPLQAGQAGTMGMQQTNQSKNAGNSFNFAQNPAGAAGNSMGMAAFQNQMGGQVGANLQGMAGMQQQMSAMQNMAGMQNVAGMQNLQGFQSGNASNQNPAARLQQMQVLLQQQQQQQPNGVNGLGNQMQFAGMQGSFGQQNQGQQQAQFSQQQMLNMLRGPQVVPQTSSMQQAVTTTTPAPNGSMPPPAVQKPGPDQKDGTQGDMTSFNW